MWEGSSQVWTCQWLEVLRRCTGGSSTYSWKSTIVPDVAFVRKHISYKAGSALPDVLLYRVECLIPGNLSALLSVAHPHIYVLCLGQRFLSNTYLELRVGPPRYFYHHVQALLVTINVQRDVVPNRNGRSITREM